MKCRPPGNRDPRAGEIDACRVYLERQLAAVLGQDPPPELSLATAHGQPVRRDGFWLFPTYHPAAAFYREELKETIQADLLHLADFLRSLPGEAMPAATPQS